ncbi:hypothetical protein BDR04DRAFT_437919 [Suillus decipiens]|nr:hypothetical protein BDR04DRAFT_437919 [Suillus decipiens]
MVMLSGGNTYPLFYITFLLLQVVIASATVFPNRVNFDLHQQFNLSVADDDQVPCITAYTLPFGPPTISLKARPITVYRQKSLNAYEHALLRSLLHAETEPIEWEQVVVSAPDIEDRHTLSQLARMTTNVYQLPGHKNWYDLDSSWNINTLLHSRLLVNGWWRIIFTSHFHPPLKIHCDLCTYHACIP